MKDKNKLLSIVCALFFFWRAVSAAINLVTLAGLGHLRYNSVVALIMTVYGIAVSAAMGVYALRRKMRGKTLNALAIIYIGYIVFNIIRSIGYGGTVRSLISLALLIAAFVLSQKACGGTFSWLRDTQSEAAKMREQTEKQSSIYDEQLRAGILTQEEYDQIMNSRQ